MTNQDLTKALVDAQLLTKAAGDKLLAEAEAARRSVEDMLYARNLVDQGELAKVKAQLLKIPYKKVDAEAISEDILKLIPAETARTYQMVPLSRTKDLLVVGLVHPDDERAQQSLRFLAQQQKTNLGVYLITPTDVATLLRRFSPFADEISAALRSVNIKPGEGVYAFQKIVRLEEGLATGTSDAPIIRIVSSLLKEAVSQEASDIHIEPQRQKLRVRLRINGDLQESTTLPIELSQALISRIKVLASLKLDETRVPQDGRFRTVIFEKEIDFRVSIFPTSSGEKAALRVLDPSVGLKSLEEIGIIGVNQQRLQEAIAKPYGMILLTGPTGSGKTTTLYALMAILNRAEVNMVSLEDPVEYTIDGVNQSQVRPEIGYDFASGLRQILRQDPDGIMVGEIRDAETAGLAVNASLTGHIVLSTLHTNNAAGVIPRLVDMGVPPFLLPPSLSAMAGQRLVSRLCTRCRKPEAAAPEVAAIIRRELAKLPAAAAASFKEPYQVYRAPGCPTCRNKGVIGRVALFEVLQMTPELSALISQNQISEAKILEESKRQGMVTLRQDGILKALAGTVGVEEVIRETEEL